MSRTFAAAYAPAERGGRPSVPPDRLLKALVLMSLYTIRSERALCERIAIDMLFRWFLGMTPDEPCFDHSVFSVNGQRLDRVEITKTFSNHVVMMAFEAELISEDHFSIDGSLLQRHASLKTLKQIERQKLAPEDRETSADTTKKDNDDNSGGADGNRWVNFREEKRSNKTHRDVSDPEARLSTKTTGVEYLQHSLHLLMENPHGIGVDIRVGKADGHAERKCDLKMLTRVNRKLGLEPATLGADKGYVAGKFMHQLDERGNQTHVACKSKQCDRSAWR